MDVLIAVYDVSNRMSYDAIEMLIKNAWGKLKGGEKALVPTIICANKADLDTVVDGHALAERLKVNGFFVTSCKTG